MFEMDGVGASFVIHEPSHELVTARESHFFERIIPAAELHVMLIGIVYVQRVT